MLTFDHTLAKKNNVSLLFQREYECSFTYASQGGTNEVSVLPVCEVCCFPLSGLAGFLVLLVYSLRDLKTSSCLTKPRKPVLFTDKLHPPCVKQVSRLPRPLTGLWQYLCSFMMLFYFTAFLRCFVVCSVLWHNTVNILRLHYESVTSANAYLTVKPYSSVLL